jgi:hypothetical protein
MLHVGFFCRRRYVLALLHFAFRADGPEVLNAADAIDSRSSALNRGQIF